MSCLEVDGFRVSSHGGLLEGLGQGRVGVARPGNVLGGSAVLDGKRGLGDHLAGVGADDVNTKDAVGLSVGNELDDTLGLEVGLGTGVGAEWEGTDAVVDTGGLDFSLVLANPRDFGVSVHDAGDSAVVDVAVALLDVLDGGNTFLLSLVGKHGAERAVTDDTDVGVLGAVLLVDHQTALLVLLNSGVLQAETLGVGATANGDQDDISVQGLLLTTLGGLDAEGDGGTAVVTTGDLGVGLELDTLLTQDLLGLLGDLSVHTGTTDLAQEFDDGNFGTETRPDGSLQQLAMDVSTTLTKVRTYHLQTDDTTTNDNHLLGDLLELEGTSAGDDSLLVDVQAGEGGRLRASGNEDVLSAEGLLTTLVEVDLDGVGVNQGTGTLDVVNAVLLEQKLDTLGEAVDGGVLGGHHLLEVELDITNLNTAFFCVVEDLVVEVGVVEERLRGDTADVQAGTTETTALLDTCGLLNAQLACISGTAGIAHHGTIKCRSYLQTGLTGLDGSNVTSDTTTNDHNIVVTYCQETITISSDVLRRSFPCFRRVPGSHPHHLQQTQHTSFSSITPSRGSQKGHRRNSKGRLSGLGGSSAEARPR